MKLLPRLAIAVALAAPLTSQIEHPYFSLTTNRTFGSWEEPSIELAGSDVGQVQIRVYRINDPVKFYTELEDAHSFGNSNPRNRQKRSWIETLHDWKRGLRRDIRSSLRSQFTESPSAHFKKPGGKPPLGPVSKETYFAQAPVLNQEQLVLSFIQPFSGADRWTSVPVPIRVKDKGLYLVEAVHASLRAYTLVTVSDLVLLNKSSRSGVTSFLADRKTGQPMASVPIHQVEKSYGVNSQLTNSEGLSSIKLQSTHTDAMRLLAVRGKDIAFNEVGFYYGGGTQEWTGYIYTDRPVYRPGDTVHFRGILRKQLLVGYETPGGASVRVEINDPEGKAIYQKTLTANPNGIIHDELTLEKSSALGNFYVQVHGDESTMAGSFEVQDYKKPEYEVHVAPEKTRVLQGQQITAVIDSKYYFGEPVAGAKVSYSIYRSHYWFPYWYEPGEEMDSDERQSDNDEDEGSAGEELQQGEGTLDSDGKLTITVPTTVSGKREDYVYRIEAGVTDKAGREISGSSWVTATYGSFSVFAEPASYVATPGASIQVKVSARDYDNKPVATAVHLQIGTWNTRQQAYEDIASQTDVVTGADGEAEATVTVPAKGGEIRLIVSANSSGRTVEGSAYVWAASGGFNWDNNNQRNLKIAADKKFYKKGDKAKLLVIAGKPDTAILVTVEGRDLRSHRVLRAKDATAEFEYEVTADDEPGFFVSAQYIREGVLYQGQKRISVPPEDHNLNLKITTDKASYTPGETAVYDIEATKPDGSPAANTDLSVGVVDEAIYAIRKDQAPNVLNFFYGREYDAVYTQTSLTYYFSGEASTRRMMLAALRPRSVMAQLKPEQLVKPKIRKIFPDTAFWQADLTTGNNGHVKAQVPFPDSLTTWRATVRGVAAGDRFGSQTAKVIVRKNLILRVAAPRFFVQGDEAVITAIVHNYLETGKRSKVNVKLENLEIISGAATQEIEVPSKGEAKADWRIKAKNIGSAKITGEALTNEEADALELSLPVHPPGIAIRQASGGSSNDSETRSALVTFPATAIAGSRSVSVRLSSSLAGSIFNALDFLVSFPYGCVEQTMSSFLPDLMVQKSVRELGIKHAVDEGTLHEKIQAGLDRLYSFQHSDGGWGWWQTDETHPFMTAYVVAGLLEAKSNGVAINENALRKGVSWVSKKLADDDSLAPDLAAYMEYSLSMAGKPAANAVNKTFGNRSELSPYGIALLGLALEQTKDGRAATLAESLLRSAKVEETEASWPAARDQMLDFDSDVTPEATAYAMKFLSHETPSNPILAKAALYLVNHRNEGYWWSSTKQTAMVIYGLLDYVKASNELHPDFAVTVSVNGKKVAEQEFRAEQTPDGPEIQLDESKLQAGANQVTIESRGKGRLYYSVTGVHYSNEARTEKQGAVSLNLLRDYFRLVPNQAAGKITYDLKPLEGGVALGDVLAVRLTVTGSDWRYLLLEDPIPAGTEFIEKDNLYEITNRPPWWRYGFSRRELHDNRMAIFDTFFSEQQKQYFYLLKVVRPGSFQSAPARVEPMYQPGHLATTESRLLEVIQ